jgi:hypothetical protein
VRENLFFSAHKKLIIRRALTFSQRPDFFAGSRENLFQEMATWQVGCEVWKGPIVLNWLNINLSSSIFCYRSIWPEGLRRSGKPSRSGTKGLFIHLVLANRTVSRD